MLTSRSYSEPLRSHLIRKFWADVRTVFGAAVLALAVFAFALVIGHTILKTALIVTVEASAAPRF